MPSGHKDSKSAATVKPITREEFERLLRSGPDRIYSLFGELERRMMMAEETATLYRDQVSILQEQDRLKEEIIGELHSQLDEQERRIVSITSERDALVEQTGLLRELTQSAEEAEAAAVQAAEELRRRLEQGKNRRNLRMASARNRNVRPALKLAAIITDMEVEYLDELDQPDTVDAYPNPFPRTFSDAHLADMIGVSRQTACAIMGELEDDGLIFVQRRPSPKKPASGRRRTGGQLVKHIASPAGWDWQMFLSNLAAWEPTPDQMTLSDDPGASADDAEALFAPDAPAPACASHGSELRRVWWCDRGQHPVYDKILDIDGPARPARAPGRGRGRIPGPGTAGRGILAPGPAPFPPEIR